jgi:hypothetical protein
MKMTNMQWMMIGIPVALLGLGAAGIPIARLFPLAFLIACPLMMMGMHGGRASHGNHGRDNRIRGNDVRD